MKIQIKDIPWGRFAQSTISQSYYVKTSKGFINLNAPQFSQTNNSMVYAILQEPDQKITVGAKWNPSDPIESGCIYPGSLIPYGQFFKLVHVEHSVIIKTVHGLLNLNFCGAPGALLEDNSVLFKPYPVGTTVEMRFK